MNKPVVTFRKLVMPKDLNPANRLFGGQMMAWIDEAAALYAMCQSNTTNIVTANISEINFRKPVFSGDFLVFEAETTSIGKSSFNVRINVEKKVISGPYDRLSYEHVCDCFITFVTIDPETGKSIPHGMK